MLCNSPLRAGAFVRAVAGQPVHDARQQGGRNHHSKLVPVKEGEPEQLRRRPRIHPWIYQQHQRHRQQPVPVTAPGPCRPCLWPRSSLPTHAADYRPCPHLFYGSSLTTRPAASANSERPCSLQEQNRKFIEIAWTYRGIQVYSSAHVAFAYRSRLSRLFVIRDQASAYAHDSGVTTTDRRTAHDLRRGPFCLYASFTTRPRSARLPVSPSLNQPRSERSRQKE